MPLESRLVAGLSYCLRGARSSSSIPFYFGRCCFFWFKEGLVFSYSEVGGSARQGLWTTQSLKTSKGSAEEGVF